MSLPGAMAVDQESYPVAAMNAAASVASGASSLRAFLDDTVEHLRRLHQIDHTTILLAENGRFVAGAWTGVSDELILTLDGKVISPEMGSCGAAICTGESHVVADITLDPRYDVVADRFLAEDIRSVWSVPLKLPDGQILGSFAVYHRDVYEPSIADIELGASLATVVALGLDRLRAQANLAESYESVVVALGRALDARDEYTGRHSGETADLAVAVAARLGLSQTTTRVIRQVAVLHDIGKLGIPGEILTKPGRSPTRSSRSCASTRRSASASSPASPTWPASPSRSRTSTSAGTARATPTASPARRSRWPAASSSPVTPGTR